MLKGVVLQYSLNMEKRIAVIRLASDQKVRYVDCMLKYMMMTKWKLVEGILNENK